MATKPVEILLYEFFAEEIEAATDEDSQFFGLELHDTIYQKIKKNCGIRISDAISEIVPAPDQSWKEMDCSLTIACYSRVLGKEKTDRQPALIKLFLLQQAVTALLREKSTLNNRVCDLLLQKMMRGYDVLDWEPFAVANIPIIINPSGESYTR